MYILAMHVRRFREVYRLVTALCLQGETYNYKDALVLSHYRLDYNPKDKEKVSVRHPLYDWVSTVWALEVEFGLF